MCLASRVGRDPQRNDLVSNIPNNCGLVLASHPSAGWFEIKKSWGIVFILPSGVYQSALLVSLMSGRHLSMKLMLGCEKGLVVWVWVWRSLLLSWFLVALCCGIIAKSALWSFQAEP